MRTFLPFAMSLILLAPPALADWSLDPQHSHLSFVSIKSGDLAEVNHFKEMSGSIDADGRVEVRLMLDSVETLVPIRNERMREVLFNTTNYREAVLRARIEPAQLAALEVGAIAPLTAEAELSLHGQTQPMILKMQAARLDAARVMVASREPLIIEAEKFGLSQGVEALREIAGLSSISRAVPVTFVVTFVAAGD